MTTVPASMSCTPPGRAATEIAKATQLLDGGAITQAEFDAIKAKKALA